MCNKGLTIITGRTGSGKTNRIFQKIIENKNRRQLCIVPSVYAYDMNRRICAVAGDQVSAYARVLTFTQLAQDVLSRCGGLVLSQSDGTSDLMIMHQAIKSCDLQVFHRSAEQISFAQQLVFTYKQLKSNGKSPEDFLAAAKTVTGYDVEKLRELGTIFCAYESMSGQRSRLDLLAEALENHVYLADTDIFVDCYQEFTPQEQRILRAMIRQAHSVTITLPCEKPDGTAVEMVFATADRTCAIVRAMADEAGCSCTFEETSTEKSNIVLNQLEKLWCGKSADQPHVLDKDTDAVEIYAGVNPYGQVEFAAGKILELVQKQGYRWNEVTVTARSIEEWEDKVRCVFQEYGIPNNLPPRDLLQNSVISTITAVLDVLSGNFACEDVLRYLKSGLTGVNEDELDLLENYVLTWNISGSYWTRSKPWAWHPDGYGNELKGQAKQQVYKLNLLREQLMEPFRKILASSAATGAGWADILYGFIQDIGLIQTLENRIHALVQNGNEVQAEEYAKAWDVVCSALEAFHSSSQQESMSLREFVRVFRTVLHQPANVKAPNVLDCVHVVSVTELACSNPRCLLVLGTEDTSFPRISSGSGLLTDREWELLLNINQDEASLSDRRAQSEMAILYRIVSLPSEKLVVCYSEHDALGEGQRPSMLVTRLKDLVPNCVKMKADNDVHPFRSYAPMPALCFVAAIRNQDGKISPELLRELKDIPDMTDFAGVLEKSDDVTRGSLSKEATKALYTDYIGLSATRVDKLKSCHFAYFMQYGLKANPRSVAELDPLTIGNLVHEVLEKLLKWAKEDAGGIKNLDNRIIQDKIEEIVEAYITVKFGTLEDKPARFGYLIDRMKRSINIIAQNVVEELKNSDFEPTAFELSFGKDSDYTWEIPAEDLTLYINGKVDRLDTWQSGIRLYYRVVDYKTGSISFDFNAIYSGRKLQLLLYLYVIKRQGIGDYRNGTLIPAGVLYLPAKEAVLSELRELEDGDKKTVQKYQEAVYNKLRRDGLLILDKPVLEAMDHSKYAIAASGKTQEYKRFLPVTIKQDGEFTSTTNDHHHGGFGLDLLEYHVNGILKQIAQEFVEGNIDADPYYYSANETPCKYCDYAAACHFEEGMEGSNYRYLSHMSQKNFWKKIGDLYADSDDEISS